MQMTTRQTLESAFAQHQAGRMREAEQMYRQVLAADPGQADALHLLGVLAHQVGRNDQAVELIRKAIGRRADFAQAYYNLGTVLKALGQLDDAIAAWRGAIAAQADFAEAHNNLGVGLSEKGEVEEAEQEFRRALEHKPDYPEAHMNLGNVFGERGQWDEAVAAHRRALALAPKYAEALGNLGKALRQTGQLEDATATFRKVLALTPHDPAVAMNLGGVLSEQGQWDEAMAAFRQALVLWPEYAEAHSSLGNALRAKGQIAEAIAACRRALALKPDLADAYNHLGNALKGDGQFAEALAAFGKAIELQPDYAEAHANLALVLLLQGDFSLGWQEYEWRRKCRGFAWPHKEFAQPQWDGRELGGRTILLHAEQGLGDVMQFIRYVPLVVERGGRVLVECAAELHRLLQATPGVEQWLAPGAALPAFEVHCPLLSLPGIFGTRLETIPRCEAYVQADAAGVEKWKRALAGDAARLKVGLAWAGRATHSNDRNRSMSLAAMARLGKVAGVSFYSLQKGQAGAQAKTAPLAIIDRTEELKDFADTAALVANLDLVISVDTAVVHLAGAMGKPVWTLLPLVPDWRWLLGREDSPWYPGMRLFRQTSLGDWADVMARVRKALAREKEAYEAH